MNNLKHSNLKSFLFLNIILKKELFSNISVYKHNIRLEMICSLICFKSFFYYLSHILLIESVFRHRCE